VPQEGPRASVTAEHGESAGAAPRSDEQAAGEDGGARGVQQARDGGRASASSRADSGGEEPLVDSGTGASNGGGGGGAAGGMADGGEAGGEEPPAGAAPPRAERPLPLTRAAVKESWLLSDLPQLGKFEECVAGRDRMIPSETLAAGGLVGW
jgi:hypothetical protein